MSFSANYYTLGIQIGAGAYGTITQVTNQEGIQYVAKIPKAHKWYDTIIEISTLLLVQGCANIIQIVDINPSLGPDNLHPAIILPLYEGNALLYGPKTFEGLRYAMFDICNAMLALHNREVLHLDLKPENILYSSIPTPHYVLTDFGISLKVHSDEKAPHSCSAQTIYYRAPEIALSRTCNTPCIYTYSADLWSIGIIMGEFALNLVSAETFPIVDYIIKYQDTSNNVDLNYYLLKIIYTIFGKGIIDPDIPVCPKVAELVSKFEDPRELFSYMPALEYEFMMLFLKLNPKARANYETIFTHPYFNGLQPSECPTMMAIDRVRTIDILDIKLCDTEIRIGALKWIHDILKQNELMEGWLLVIALFDMCCTKNIVDYDNVNVVGIACIILASITSPSIISISDGDMLTMWQFGRTIIYNMVQHIVITFEYNIYICSELDYLEAYLDDMGLDDKLRENIKLNVFEKLILASYSPYFRTWSKDIIVSNMIVQFMGYKIKDINMDILKKLGVM